MTDKVVVVGDFSVAQRNRRSYHPRQRGVCHHRHIELDDHGEVVMCLDCNTQVTPYWALKMLAENFNEARDKLERERQSVAEERASILHLVAAKKVEAVWRTKSMVPACPHCHAGILPSDGLGSCTFDRRIELARRDANRGKPQNDGDNRA